MSAELTAEVADSDFQRMLLRFAAYKNRRLPEIVRAQARLMCVNLAHNTQPYGADSAARFKGTNAVRRDLHKVFIGPDRIIALANNIKQDAPAIARQLINAVRAQDTALTAGVWRVIAGRSITATTAPDPQWHRGQRNSRGRVRGRGRPMLVLSASALRTYTLTKEKLVGFAKSGWAAAARALGGTRGIPGWVSRNRGPGGAEDRTADRDWPRVILSNQVRYIDTVLPPIEVARALRLQEQKMNRAMQHQMDAELRAA